MKDIQKIRFVAANYGALQGLRMLPFNLLALVVAWWANQQSGSSRNLAFPLLMFGLCCLLYLGVDRYYQRSFGQVQQKPAERTADMLIAIAWGFLAMVGFSLDTGLDFPFSTLGLVFALGLLAEFVRLTRRAPGPYVRYYLLLAALMAAISLLPLISSDSWWQALGFRTPVLAILAVLGLIGILAGLISHFYLLHTLHAAEGASDAATL